MTDLIQPEPIFLAPEDLAQLRTAKGLLENPGLAARLTNLLGQPVEKGMRMLPERWVSRVHGAVEVSLRKALEFAVLTMGKKRTRGPRARLHKMAAIGSGAMGGAFGLVGLPLELPVSTTIMLRSVAAIAAHEGEDLSDMEARLNCLQVFALGGPSKSDDAAETGYYAVRAVMAKTISEAATFIAERGLVREGAPALVRFMSAIGSRFSTAVSEKIAAGAIPALGAAGGALVNAVFMEHFQNMAKGHFTVRRLERKYGIEAVREAYSRLPISG